MSQNFSQIKETFEELVEDPDKRFQKFFDFYCNSIPMDPAFSVEKYLRGGREVIRMANVYFGEQDYLHSFVLYSRYIVLFLDKIKTHPGYSSADRNEIASISKQIKTIAFPRAEKLKKLIKDMFMNEADAFKREKEETAKLREKQQQETKTNPSAPSHQQQFDDIKHKYDEENEREYQDLVARFGHLNNESGSRANSASATTKKINDDSEAKKQPTIDRSLKPQLSDKRVNNYNLRTLYVPSNLPKKFLRCAEANTNRNVETCGILAGKMIQNMFTISHCVLPKQSGTSETCSTENEWELFDTVDKLNLFTLGWIHTHPSQTAFLSSVDLHTHYAYQTMIPESIAIVCAPSFNETGTYILTPGVGLNEIGQCKKSGFHPHTKIPPLFEESDHVIYDDSLDIVIIDLRDAK